MLLPVPGGPIEQQIVAARRCDLERAPRARLTLDVPEIGMLHPGSRRLIVLGRRNGFAPGKMCHDTGERARSVNPRFGQHGLGGIVGRHDDCTPHLACPDDSRKQARDRAQCTVECQLTVNLEVFEGRRRELSLCRKDPQRDGKIVAPARLAHLGGPETDRDALLREVETGAHERAANAVLAFPHGCLGHAHDREGR